MKGCKKGLNFIHLNAKRFVTKIDDPRNIAGENISFVKYDSNALQACPNEG